MSEPEDSFNKHVKALTELSLNIADDLNNESLVWKNYVTRFMQAYTAANNPDGFREMFMRFFRSNVSQLSRPIMNDEMEFNDKWLKSTEVIPHPASKKVASYSLKQFCRGIIVYFSDDNEKLRAVSIPISEIYNAALKLCARDHVKYVTLPASVIYHFFSIILAVIPRSFHEREVIQRNVDVIREAIKGLGSSPDKIENKTMGNINGMGSLIKEMVKQAGMKVPEKSSKDMDAALDRMMNGDVIAKIGNLVSTISADSEGSDLSSVLRNVGKALQNDELNATVADITAKHESEAQNLVASIPARDQSFGSVTSHTVSISGQIPGFANVASHTVSLPARDQVSGSVAARATSMRTRDEGCDSTTQIAVQGKIQIGTKTANPNALIFDPSAQE